MFSAVCDIYLRCLAFLTLMAVILDLLSDLKRNIRNRLSLGPSGIVTLYKICSE